MSNAPWQSMDPELQRAGSRPVSEGAESAGDPGGRDGDDRYMARALELAERGRATVSPNPMVGCVIVRDHRVVGEGWHRRPGTPHAEVHALRAAGDAARGATAYVTLEPCSHHGRTPPCSDALVRAGVRRVVVAAGDPNPLVNGAGLRRLREAGVEVRRGVMRAEVEAQNEAFLTAQRTGRPFVLYKTAMSLDGRIATRTGASRWITGEAARARVQRWRHWSDAVAVGVGTVLADDPLLTARIAGGRTPLKVIFDSTARTPTDAALFRPDRAGEPARVLIVAADGAPRSRTEALRRSGATVVELEGEDGRPSVREALSALRDREVGRVLLEGGGTLAWSFFAAGAVDRVAWFVAPMLLGGGGATPLAGAGVARLEDAIRLEGVRTEACGDDLLLEARVASFRRLAPPAPATTRAGERGDVTARAAPPATAREVD